MNDRMDILCAELCAIEYWDWNYRHSPEVTESDDLSHELREERRAQIISEIQVIFAKSRALK